MLCLDQCGVAVLAQVSGLVLAHGEDLGAVAFIISIVSIVFRLGVGGGSL